MLTLNAVSFRYPTAPQDVLRNVSLTVRDGVITAVMGLNGSGKTTLLNLLGLLWDRALDRGTITYRDEQGGAHEFGRLTPPQKAALRRQEFGFVFQSAHMLSHFTCAQNIAMPLEIQQTEPAKIRRRVINILRRADPSRRLCALRRSLPGEVSGGECQRMGLLRAVIHDPRVLFADEPLSNLDPENKKYMLKLLEAWMQGHLHGSRQRRRALILVTHDAELAYDWAQDFIILRNGCLVRGKVVPKKDLADGKEIINLMMSDEAGDTGRVTEAGQRRSAS